MARLPRKPKLLKYPKKPKASSSTATLAKYLDRVKLIDSTNRDRMSDYTKALRDFESDKKHHAELVKRISGIGNPTVKARPARKRKKVSGIGKARTKKRAAKKTARKRATRRSR